MMMVLRFHAGLFAMMLVLRSTFSMSSNAALPDAAADALRGAGLDAVGNCDI